MTTEKDNSLHDKHAAALDEAAALRALHKYRAARQRALDHGAELGVSHPEPPDYDTIGGRYYGIMAEWLNESISNSTAALSATNLLADIAAARQLDDALDEGTGPASSEEDHADMLRLIARLHEYVNQLTFKDYAKTIRREALPEPDRAAVLDLLRATVDRLQAEGGIA
ncbi:MAG TPA: hypothetical protein VNF04_04110 [Stellaceae bacterium]|nr:hypothetical protein [Stellaceae bacterium]